jgi:rubredoxin/uncharacterized membrane protein
MKKWQCTVCGYIHDGNEPPETCPVCGADKSQFIEIADTSDDIDTQKKPAADKTAEIKPESAASEPSPPLFSLATVTSLMLKYHLHPITVHFPNGVIPVAVAFIFLAAIFEFVGLSNASFYNMVFVVLTLPVVLFTGYNEWKNKYQGAVTSIFKVKIISALIVTVTAVIIVLWHLVAPESHGQPFFLVLHLIMLAATGIAGHLGGKLVFKE